MFTSTKLVALVAVGAAGCSAFVPAVPATAVRAPALRMAAKINESIELDSPKVVNNVSRPPLNPVPWWNVYPPRRYQPRMPSYSRSPPAEKLVRSRGRIF